MRIKEFIYGRRLKLDCDKVVGIETNEYSYVCVMLEGGNCSYFYADSPSREWCTEIYNDISREVWGK